jgi:hypothetical protein
MNDDAANDSVLDRFSSKVANGDATLQPDHDAADDLGAFGWLRGVRDRAIMLELRHKDGSITAYGYAWLKKATLNPSGEIVLDFSGETVKITGRNLNGEIRPHVRLLNGIVRHRVPWIQESDGPSAMEAAKDAVVIEHLEAN